MGKIRKRYSVFVSSTFKDLKEERAAILLDLVKIYCIPLGMEYFDASDTSQIDIIKEYINESDYYILIIGGRYGTPYNDKISYTMWEYEYAKEHNIPVLVFIRNEKSIPDSKKETDADLLSKLEKFKCDVSKDNVCFFWDKKRDLIPSVSRSLLKEMINNPRPGWKKCMKKNSNYSKKLSGIDEVILKYLELCDCFKNSDIWKDKEAIKQYEKLSIYDYPILLLYNPIVKASEILRKLKTGVCDIKDNYESINHIAGEIWYAIDCRSDVKDCTTNDSITVSDKTVKPLIKHFGINSNVLINRSFLRDISGRIWEELGGDI